MLWTEAGAAARAGGRHRPCPISPSRLARRHLPSASAVLPGRVVGLRTEHASKFAHHVDMPESKLSEKVDLSARIQGKKA